ncbi:MAG: hypothetical protein KME27_10580 [Lyngbya sp. HA4199-MV5]|nr:hypothetical protein [Lyngbya sp. HA4199-MV5]
MQQANSIATPLHGVAATIAGCNGVKRPTEATEFVNPYALALYQREAKALVPVAAARTTLRLWDEGKLPGWVVEWLDRRLLEAAASE